MTRTSLCVFSSRITEVVFVLSVLYQEIHEHACSGTGDDDFDYVIKMLPTVLLTVSDESLCCFPWKVF